MLKKILVQLGAQSEVLSGEQGRNPLVLATFFGLDTGKTRMRTLFYGKANFCFSNLCSSDSGHYDVQPAAEGDWETDPWELAGRNGYVAIERVDI